MQELQNQDNQDLDMRKVMARHKQIDLEVTRQLTHTRAIEIEVEHKIGMSLSQLKNKIEKGPQPTTEQTIQAKKMVNQLLQQQNGLSTIRPPKNREMI